MLPKYKRRTSQEDMALRLSKSTPRSTTSSQQLSSKIRPTPAAFAGLAPAPTELVRFKESSTLTNNGQSRLMVSRDREQSLKSELEWAVWDINMHLLAYELLAMFLVLATGVAGWHFAYSNM